MDLVQKNLFNECVDQAFKQINIQINEILFDRIVTVVMDMMVKRMIGEILWVYEYDLGIKVADNLFNHDPEFQPEGSGIMDRVISMVIDEVIGKMAGD